jgi:hypothetical protein
MLRFGLHAGRVRYQGQHQFQRRVHLPRWFCAEQEAIAAGWRKAKV